MPILFQGVSVAVLQFWLLMIVLPRWRLTVWLFRSPWVLVPLPALYAILVVPHLPGVLPLLLNPQLDEIAGLLGRPEAALIGWIHFLAFDLFVGRWIYLDSMERHIHPLLTAPILLLTMMLGPAGLLLYLLGVRPLASRDERTGLKEHQSEVSPDPAER
jgi:hypothetical protein